MAIDGPGASGKSTAGKTLAARLGYLYIDTGALYRAVAWLADRHGITPDNPKGLIDLVNSTVILLVSEGASQKVLLDGRDISEEIRTETMGRLASAFSALPDVRQALLELQRNMGAAGGVVMDGRDIGTVVFPDAEVKIFLYANGEERSRRRWQELLDKGHQSDLQAVHRDLLRRDELDSGRTHAPLRAASDAVRIDSTGLTPAEVVERILEIFESKTER